MPSVFDKHSTSLREGIIFRGNYFIYNPLSGYFISHDYISIAANESGFGRNTNKARVGFKPIVNNVGFGKSFAHGVSSFVF